MEVNKLLPIGSIVRLKNAEKRLLIYGIKQKITRDIEEEFKDYIGVVYPEGNIGMKYQYLFDHENIDEVIFRGFEDSERDAFIERLNVFFNQAAPL